ncbi:glycosyltransferase family 2 protein [Microbacterium memoriense]|uniref:Glycosyltransferase family 2 protein n=1 Tax=Microbacterium memoriense TaxID=2978350 RepID=A0ABT2PDG9_9MICO|nr:glycosyltransferase family 2 protein [Microbacterium memoriense]MCT9002637.1 glycosyltransferase family 2 protein [Microbacterium memoriense]
MSEFTGPLGPADVAVIIVTYNNANDIETLLTSLRPETRDQSIRVVVADNASSDGTLDIVRMHDDVIAVATGGNLGYAGGINVAMRHVGVASAYLVLNPDLVVLPGCVAALRERLRVADAGIVVPAIVDRHGTPSTSLRNEPSVTRALGDAAFGGRPRPAFVPSETVFAPAAYSSPREVQWATGAALLIAAPAAAAAGPWDDRFFLYSEETDFFRRVRDAGRSVWYEPAAVVRHAAGGSGSSVDLERLMAVNRIRYARKHMGAARAAAFRGAVIIHELVRAYDRSHRLVLRTVVTERRWKTLPQAGRTAVAR